MSEIIVYMSLPAIELEALGKASVYICCLHTAEFYLFISTYFRRKYKIR